MEFLGREELLTLVRAQEQHYENQLAQQRLEAEERQIVDSAIIKELGERVAVIEDETYDLKDEYVNLLAVHNAKCDEFDAVLMELNMMKLKALTKLTSKQTEDENEVEEGEDDGLEGQPESLDKATITKDFTEAYNEYLESIGATNVNTSVEGAQVKQRCRYWPLCKRGDRCIYVHPAKFCTKYPNCDAKFRCLYRHPNCQNGSSCTVPSCIRIHPDDFERAKKYVQCRYMERCRAVNCPFMHPSAAKPDAKPDEGAQCSNDASSLNLL